MAGSVPATAPGAKSAFPANARLSLPPQGPTDTIVG